MNDQSLHQDLVIPEQQVHAPGTVLPLPVATLIIYSGQRRGKTIRLSEADYCFNAQQFDVMPAPADTSVCAFSLHRADNSYEIVARAEQRLFVNGSAQRNARLDSEDLIELEDGPVFRFRLYPADHEIAKSVRAILTDCIDCARRDERPIWRAGPWLIAQAVRSMLTQTSRWFRALVVLCLILGAIAIAAGAWRSLQIGDQQARDERRIEALEAAALSTEKVIASASPSVVFIQGKFGFRESDTGKRLRFVAGPDGTPFRMPNGMPALTMDERGKLLEIDFSGTAFVVGADGLLITNRHVAIPWENDTSAFAQFVSDKSLNGFLVQMHGYMPGFDSATEIEMLRASDEADVALLQGAGELLRREPLSLANSSPAPGEKVVLLGYPAGIRALLARAPKKLRVEVAGSKKTPAEVANSLAMSGLIQPLASRGIVGQVSGSVIVYDAETTSGGSGGPLLNERGEVIAVNMAILPEFGGSNLGVPIAQVHKLLDEYQRQGAVAK